MSAIVYIPNHADIAEGQLPEQYKGKTRITALVRMFGTRAQVVEDISNDILTHGDVETGHDCLLDQLGDIVGQPRNGMDDATYRVFILSKITRNISKGTPETLLRICMLLLTPTRMYYRPVYPAGFSLTAIGNIPGGGYSANLITYVKNAINASRIGGSAFEYLATVDSNSFSFSDDPDPSGSGFGDSTNGSVGGYLAQII